MKIQSLSVLCSAFYFFCSFLGAFLVFFFVLNCHAPLPPSDSTPPRQSSTIHPAQSSPEQRGKALYRTYCTSCHHLNPHQTLPMGPALFGSSQLLLKEKILHGTYPKNYQPKQQTQTMPTFPDLQKEIDSFWIYLNDSQQ